MGLLRALGCSAPKLFFLVLCDSLLISVAGCAAGITAAIVLRNGIGSWLRSTLSSVPSGQVIALDPRLLVSTALVVVALCLLSAVYPAWRACRVPPARSLRGGLR